MVDIILRLLMWGWREAHFGEVVTCLSYTKLGDVIAAGSRSGRIFVMSAQTGEKRLCNVTVDHRGSHGEICCMAYSPSGDTVAVGCFNGNVAIVQVTNGPEAWTALISPTFVTMEASTASIFRHVAASLPLLAMITTTTAIA